jgi:acetoin utilization deacetylase AcuC-like enzyme
MADRIQVFTHPDCVRHDPGAGHPETPARLQAVLARLAREPLVDLRQATPASPELLLTTHPEHHLQLLQAISEQGGGAVSLDTAASAASWAAVLAATGSVREALRHAMDTGGHAFAARAAQAEGRERILIVDWDVHHGNGTQALMEHDATIRFVSMHQHPWYPGTGMAHERGVGNVFNVPRGAGAPRSLYVEDLWSAVHAATEGWPPDLLLISAGYDAMLGDPLGGFTLEPEDYASLTTRLRERFPSAPIVALLEGGYDPARLSEGVAATVGAMT